MTSDDPEFERGAEQAQKLGHALLQLFGTLLFTGFSQDGSQQFGRGDAAFGTLEHEPPVNVRERQGTPQMREQRHGFPDAKESCDHACDQQHRTDCTHCATSSSPATSMKGSSSIHAGKSPHS